METLKVISAYAKLITPFAAAILGALNTYEARKHRWRFFLGIAVTALLVVFGIIGAL